MKAGTCDFQHEHKVLEDSIKRSTVHPCRGCGQKPVIFVKTSKFQIACPLRQSDSSDTTPECHDAAKHRRWPFAVDAISDWNGVQLFGDSSRSRPA